MHEIVGGIRGLLSVIFYLLAARYLTHASLSLAFQDLPVTVSTRLLKRRMFVLRISLVSSEVYLLTQTLCTFRPSVVTTKRICLYESIML